MLEHRIEYWDEDRTIKYYEHWKLDGKYHRDNSPAYIRYYKTGDIRYKEYYQNGEYHNLKGPAAIFYSRDGNICAEYYYIEGVEYSKTKWRKARKQIKGKENVLY